MASRAGPQQRRRSVIRSSATPPVWSGWWCVTRMASVRSPWSCRALSTSLRVAWIDHQRTATVVQKPDVVVGKSRQRVMFMEPAIIGSTAGLPEWFQTAPGRYLLDWERAQFDQAVADLFRVSRPAARLVRN